MRSDVKRLRRSMTSAAMSTDASDESLELVATSADAQSPSTIVGLWPSESHTRLFPDVFLPGARPLVVRSTVTEIADRRRTCPLVVVDAPVIDHRGHGIHYKLDAVEAPIYV